MTVGALDTSNKYFTFQDESPLPLCLSVIPVVGTVIQLMKEHSILTRFNKSDQQAEKVELMKTYKNYTYVSLARNVLILAGVITGLVLNIFVPIVGYIVFPILGLSLTIGLFKAAPSPERMVIALYGRRKIAISIVLINLLLCILILLHHATDKLKILL